MLKKIFFILTLTTFSNLFAGQLKEEWSDCRKAFVSDGMGTSIICYTKPSDPLPAKSEQLIEVVIQSVRGGETLKGMLDVFVEKFRKTSDPDCTLEVIPYKEDTFYVVQTSNKQYKTRPPQKNWHKFIKFNNEIYNIGFMDFRGANSPYTLEEVDELISYIFKERRDIDKRSLARYLCPSTGDEIKLPGNWVTSCMYDGRSNKTTFSFGNEDFTQQIRIDILRDGAAEQLLNGNNSLFNKAIKRYTIENDAGQKIECIEGFGQYSITTVNFLAVKKEGKNNIGITGACEMWDKESFKENWIRVVKSHKKCEAVDVR